MNPVVRGSIPGLGVKYIWAKFVAVLSLGGILTTLTRDIQCEKFILDESVRLVMQVS